MSTAPTLTTDRLLLRGHQPNDLDACVALWQDPAVIQYTTGQPLARQDVWTRLLRHPGHWALFGYGYWLVFEQTTGRFVGELGLARFKRTLLDNQPEFDALPEAGWVLMPWAHGRGYAREAMTAVLKWHDQQRIADRSFCIIQPENVPSLRLADLLGYQPQFQLPTLEPRWTILTRTVTS
ncbi:GNAT family N-acetyltransferase (plasmid) [Deinococcus sp. KNUC1210]|uniref:GNAT family N-acetyltransferase n=1 Tax=Deinococcus sp. KNUC1210 TaxID=2917691 RepID=UPI001EF0CC9C|nr:GNAT family N-acetyltransferase [Deinococcus sp. KNUC1210]ULH18308.1 GNAT family N-acetyltransferase [Deinococcus sp. KNUC1210]